MNILTFSSLYPNNVDEGHGIFVERRLRELTKSGAIHSSVIAPVPWFPFRADVFGQYGKFARIDRSAHRSGIDVEYPRYPSIPKIGMNVAARLMVAGCRAAVDECVQRKNVALIDAHYFYPDGVAAANLARKLGIPFVITARGSDINLIAQFRAPREQMVRAANSASALIAVSDALAIAMHELGMPQEKITVCRNGVDLGFFCPADRESVRSQLSLTETTFLSVGALKAFKGHDIAIQFLADTRRTVLAIAGKGPDRARLEFLARDLGVSDRVRFLGQLGPYDLRQWYQATDALILMSEREGLPNVVLESLACGTPVLASKAGGIPEVVSSPAAGMLADSRDVEGLHTAWERLLRRRVSRESTRTHAQAYSWSESVRVLRTVMFDAVK
jgi:glycosyltransferase involved in cell wall biosynthesis